jgi:hypothetical protein
MPALEFANHLAAGASSQRPPDVDVDVPGKRSGGSVHHDAVDDSRVKAAGCHGGKRRLPAARGTAATLFARNVITFDLSCPVGDLHPGVGGESRRESRFVNLAVGPFTMSARRSGNAECQRSRTHDRGRRWQCVGGCSIIPDVARVTLHLRGAQCVARAVSKVSCGEAAVRCKRAVAGDTPVRNVCRRRRENLPCPEIVSVVGWKVARRRHTDETVDFAGAAVEREKLRSDPVGRIRRIAVSHRQVSQGVSVGLIEKRQNPSVNGLRSALGCTDAVAGGETQSCSTDNCGVPSQSA